MRKLIYPFALLCAACIVTACDKEAENPGDFNMKSTLSVGNAVVCIHGDQYPLTVARQIDTTYTTYTVQYDTVKDSNGDPVIGSDGKVVTNADTVPVYSNITAAFTEYEPITLPSAADTFTVKLYSNAKWNAPVPDAGGKVQWYYTYNLITGTSSITGGGDSEVDFRVTRNKNKKRSVTAVQDIMTQDSTVLVRLRFNQAGEKD